MICPCKDCEMRTITCHSNCKPYLEYAKWKTQVNEIERKEKQFNYKSNERSKKWNKKNW